MFSDSLLMPSDRQNIFSPVSSKIQLERYYFDTCFTTTRGALIFPFLTELEYTCTLLCFSVGTSKFSYMCTFSTSASLANFLRVRKWPILQTKILNSFTLDLQNNTEE